MSLPVSDPVFEVTDWRGRIVRLTRRTFENHKDKRPEFALYIDEAKETVEDPDFIADANDGAVALVSYGLGREKFANLYLQVVVFYRGEPESGSVATFHFISGLGKMVIVERRYQWVAGARFDVRGTRGPE